MRWVIVAAIVLGCLMGWLIKSGLTVKSGEESMIHPGKPVDTYHEHVTSTYLRTKDTLREIQKKRDAEQHF